MLKNIKVYFDFIKNNYIGFPLYSRWCQIKC